jgi:ppGpp synthetase/RelA/SpoT-type nucleotidyltranferase
MSQSPEKRELEIRKYYAEIFPSLRLLKLWIDNSLSEIKENVRAVQSFSTRIKTEESVVRKVKSKGKDFLNKPVPEIFREMKDLVGARVVVKYLDGAIDLHKLLTRDMPRFLIQEIEAHDNEEDKFYKPTLDEWYKNAGKIDSSLRMGRMLPKEKPNQRGYRGIHYVIKPKIVDSFWYDNNAMPDNDFELQIHTSIHDVWCEVQHDVGYKGQNSVLPAKVAEALVNYSNEILIIEKALSRVATSDFAPKKDTSVLSKNPDAEREINGSPFAGLYTVFLDTLFELKLSKTQEFKTSIGRRFIRQQADALEKLLNPEKPPSKSILEFTVEIAHIFLITGQFEEAKKFYEFVIKNGYISEGFVLIRLLETELSLSPDNPHDAIEQLLALQRFMSSEDEPTRKPNTQKHSASFHAAKYAWRLEQLELANFFTSVYRLTDSIGQEDATEEESLRIRGNVHLLYEFAIYVRGKQTQVENDNLNFLLDKEAIYLKELLNSTSISLKSSTFFKISYFYYVHAEILSNQKEDEWNIAIKESQKYLAQCFFHEDQGDKSIEKYSTEAYLLARDIINFVGVSKSDL